MDRHNCGHKDPHIRAQELILCDLCKAKMVQVYCDTCHIKLCNACIGEHIASDESKKIHEIVRYIFRKSILLYHRCTFHEREHCEICGNQSEARSFPQDRQLLANITNTINTEHRICLYNVTCLSDDEIWTCGYESTMTLHSISRGSQLKSITTKSGSISTDIAVTKDGHLVYTDPSDKTVNIMKNEGIKILITLKKWRPCNICSTSTGDLLVVMNSDDNKHSKVDKQSRVVRYSGSTKKQIIQSDDKGHPLYSHVTTTKCIIENKNQDICVADEGAKAVVVVNHAGRLRFRYTGHTPTPRNKFDPRGITTDSQSHILVADMHSHCVHILDKDGQLLHYIDCGLSNPWGLCIDTNDNLFVAQWRNKDIKKINYFQGN